MTSKPLKEKPYAPAPRLVPRATAASAARAALNASNRNMTPVAQRIPPKTTFSPNEKRKVPYFHRSSEKIDPKVDTKPDTNVNSDMKTIQDMNNNNNEIEDVKIDLKEDFEREIEVASPREMPTVTVGDNQESQGDAPQVSDCNNNANDEPVGPPQSEDNQQAFLRDNHVEQCGRIDCTAILNMSPEMEVCCPMASRPQTPKSPAKTRTSIGGTRPSTPGSVKSATRNTTPVSRPTTPLHQSRPNKQVVGGSVPDKVTQSPTTNPSTKPLHLINTDAELLDDGDIRVAYSVTEKRLQQLKKELDLKQQAVLEVFESLCNLRERMTRESVSGGGEGNLQELLMFNVADWTSEEVSELYRDAVSAANTDKAVEILESIPLDEFALNELENKVINIPHQFVNLCLQTLSAREQLIDWCKELLLRSNNLQENCEDETLQKINNFNEQGLQLYEALRELKDQADKTVDTVSCITKRVWRDQNALIGVGKSLVRNVARLKLDLDSHTAIISEMKQYQAEAGNNILEYTRQELEVERVSKITLKDKLGQSEYQLRQSRNRVAKMDKQLREAEVSIATLTSTVKALEDQSRQKEAQIEARARKLRDTLKTGEVASGHLAQQRDVLQAEVTELKAQIENLTAQHKSNIKELKNQLKETKAAMEQQSYSFKLNELELTSAKNATLAESNATIEELKAKIKELEDKMVPENDNKPTAREMELLAELQATKVALHLVEEEILDCRKEKTRFLESLTKIADSDNKVGIQQKLAAELLSKEEIISKIQVQMREYQKNAKLLEQKVEQYEQYIKVLEAHNTSVNTEEGNETNSLECQKQILDLKMRLLQAVNKNEELSQVLAQKEQQLDQQDKTSRAQARVIKVREELINMLKNKETEQTRELTELQQDLEHRMKIVDEVNKQIAAKADEIQELFATLESKQQQIHRLEKIVLALEEQQRRAQAQRTRHEEKIAALEHELAAGGYRRERKFLFF